MSGTATRPPQDLRESGSLFAVPGIAGAAVRTGVKESGDLDLAVITAEEPMTAAAVFTTNAAAAAPVELSRAVLAREPYVRTVVINSGNANALTGERGTADALAMLDATESACGGPALVLSTGIIGVPLPVEKVRAGIEEAGALLRSGRGNALDVPRAILTTDTVEKTATARTATTPVRTVGGIAKGSGMILPDMATTLGVIATDAPIGPGALDEILREATDRSFHEISVDGDTSTNDALVLLARRPDEGRPEVEGAERAAVAAAITEVARSLAEQVVRDGEGASRVMRIDVTGADTEEDARRVARAIARSSLVKTALAGGDPNWGRILSAAGTAGGGFRPGTATLAIGDHTVFRSGEHCAVEAELLDRAFSGDDVAIALDLGRGTGTGRMYTTDLTHDYVEINSAYTT